MQSPPNYRFTATTSEAALLLKGILHLSLPWPEIHSPDSAEPGSQIFPFPSTLPVWFKQGSRYSLNRFSTPLSDKKLQRLLTCFVQMLKFDNKMCAHHSKKKDWQLEQCGLGKVSLLVARGWNQMSSKVSYKPNFSVILWMDCGLINISLWSKFDI